MENKGKLKLNKAFKIATISFLSSIVVLTAGTAAYANISLRNYSNQGQIKSIAKELDCDMGYLNLIDKKNVRMQHNGDEPIYVCFDSNLDQNQIDTTINSLDYIFGIVGKINSKYRYKVVNKSQYNKKKFKTRIFVTESELAEKTDADITQSASKLSFFTNKRTLNNYVLRINSKETGNGIALDYILNHEILHAFGVKDVYYEKNTKKHQGNTLIDTNIGPITNKITPNDLKCLMALYTEDFDSDKEELETMIKYKAQIEEYKNDYYYLYAKNIKEKLPFFTDLSIEENFVWTSDLTTLQDKAGNLKDFKYRVTVNKGHYLFEILNEFDQILDSCEGKVYNKVGVLLLEDVTLKEDMSPSFGTISYDGFINNFILVKLKGLDTKILIQPTEKGGYNSYWGSFDNSETGNELTE